jgi:hypothetical protein
VDLFLEGLCTIGFMLVITLIAGKQSMLRHRRR